MVFARVELGSRLAARCRVMRTAEEQARGLQGLSGLEEGEGMLFDYPRPRACTFHTGTVSFPFDLVWVDASRRVAGVVGGIQPGVPGFFPSPGLVRYVVELPGGACARAGVTAGRTHVRVAQLQDERVYPDGYHTDEMTEHDFTDRGPPYHDDPTGMDQPSPHWDYRYGPDLLDGDPWAFRRGQRAQLDWQPDILNAGRTESAVLLAEEARRLAGEHEAPLDTVGDALVLAGLADRAMVTTTPSGEGALVLTRGPL